MATLEDEKWELLLARIEKGKCTPFLGAGACSGSLPLGAQIASSWAADYKYPLHDTENLIRVSQYLAVQFDPSSPKEKLLDEFRNHYSLPNFRDEDEPHGVLADLPLPVYLTTNYDDFMVKALKDRGKDPKRELCRWNRYTKDLASIFDSMTGFEPTPANPIVYHLHGHDEAVDSLVLTEDDYLDFLVNVSRDPTLLPPRIHQAFTQASLLFIGYSLSDWDFKVLFRGMVATMERSQRKMSITVQMEPQIAGSSGSQEQIQKYLDAYFGKDDMKVYWGTARQFAGELRSRWAAYKKKKNLP